LTIKQGSGVCGKLTALRRGIVASLARRRGDGDARGPTGRAGNARGVWSL